MERLFIRLLQMSLTGGIVILGVLLLRLILRRAPGRFRYLLWIVPAFRLCVPLSLPSPVSLFRLFRGGLVGGGDFTPAGLTLPLEQAVSAEGAGAALPSGTALAPAAKASVFSWLSALTWIWAAVLAALLLYSLISGLLLRRRLATAVRLEGRVFQVSDIDTPFLLGLTRPRIYIPWGMEGKDLAYALAHERCHLRRGDQWWRLLGWLILCVHWYNPLCWLGFFFMGRDMEQSCDEAVLERLGDVRREYSESLLHIAGKRRLSSPAPLAFGESGVGGRVRNVLRWKHSRRWVTVTAILLCVLFTAAWITDPASLGAGTLTLNPDGTLGSLEWGMSPEEAMAADSRIVRIHTDSDEYWATHCVREELQNVKILGYTADVFLNFPKYNIPEASLNRVEDGTPILDEISITIRGEADVTEALKQIFGEQEKYMVDNSWEMVDGKPKVRYRPGELSEDKWYWHSREAMSDMIPLEQLRFLIPQYEDEELLGVCCSTFAYRVDAGSYVTEDGTYTLISIYGLGSAIQKHLNDIYPLNTKDAEMDSMTDSLKQEDM